jgi:hypothetical protein
MTQGNFKQDLQEGQEIEKEFARLLQKRHPLSTVTIVE